MKDGLIRCAVRLVICTLIVAVMITAAMAKVPDGYRDVKLGMKKGEVLELMQKSPVHFSYDDLGAQIGEIVRGDDLFRYATYRFDGDGTLVEIGLEMREILGRDKVLELYSGQTGLKLSPLQTMRESDRSVEVRNNSVILKLESAKEARAAKGNK